MKPDPARLSLNTATVKKQWKLAQIIEGCVRHGIRGISPWRDQVSEFGLNQSVKLIKSHGLTVTGLCRGGFFTAKNWLDDNRRAIEEAHTLGAQCLAIEPLHPMQAAERSCINTLEQALDPCDALGEGVGVAVDAYRVWWKKDPDEVLATCKRRHRDSS